jgi:transcriptional regulator GlxA family with amidase domain
MRPPLTLALYADDGVQLLDVAGPLDVFAEANVQAGREVYRLIVLAEHRRPIRSSSGVAIVPSAIVGEPIEKIHTLLVAGRPNAHQVRYSQRAVAWFKKTCPSCTRYGSVCSGAFMLGAAGLLDGRHVTTHWAVSEALAQRFPGAHVDADSLYVRDGRLRTAAGVTAGMDLALALVEEDLGRQIALKVASQLVMFFKRPGGQMQFSREGHSTLIGRSALQEVQRYVAAHPNADLSVGTLARRLEMSPRHFARIFRQEVGSTPATWVQSARVTAARARFEAGADSTKQVAADCGFPDINAMRRAFQRWVGTTPAEYRKQFVTQRS